MPIRKLSQSLQQLLGAGAPAEMPLTDITNQVYQILKDRNLIYENDRRVFRTDQQISDVFHLNMEHVNQSTDVYDEQGFNFTTFQRMLEGALDN